MKTDYSFSFSTFLSLAAVTGVGSHVDRIRPCDQSEHSGYNEYRRVKDYT